MGEPKLLLGIQLKRDFIDKLMKIYQEQYTLKNFQRFCMENTIYANTPLLQVVIYMKFNDEESLEYISKYRAEIGSLMYASIATCPDIAYATNFQQIS